MEITESMVRTLGGLFELAGLFTVAIGISDLRRRFSDRPPFIETVRATLKRVWGRLRGCREAQVVTADTARITISAHGARVKVGPGKNMTLEEKVAWLLSTVDQLQDRDHDLSNRIDAEKDERAKAIQDERTGREQAINELTEHIRTLATGDLTRQFWGVIAFGFGIILQVWSQEIARVL